MSMQIFPHWAPTSGVLLEVHTPTEEENSQAGVSTRSVPSSIFYPTIAAQTVRHGIFNGQRELPNTGVSQ